MQYKLVAALAATVVGPGLTALGPPVGTDWAVNATVIEACSCPMFCQCYFTQKPAAHAGHAGQGPVSKHFCRANLVYKINKGYFGATRLDGAKFWIATDLGDDFSRGQLDWAVLYFDQALSQVQRDAIAVVVNRIYPAKWRSFKTAEARIDKWEVTKEGALALLDSGRAAEVRLKRFSGLNDEPVVIRNLPYWGVPRHDGFIMMPNEVEAYRVGPNAFEFKGTSGFLITIDLTSKDFVS